MKYFGLDFSAWETFYLWFRFIAPYLAVLVALYLVLKYKNAGEDKRHFLLIALLLFVGGILEIWNYSDYMINFLG